MSVVLARTLNNNLFSTLGTNSSSDFVFLQETLLAKDNIVDSFRAKWRGQSFWSPASGKQGGVALLVKENSCFKVKQWKKDSSGRIVSVLAAIGDQRFNFVNVYAPTNPRERKGFLDTIHHFFFPNAFKHIAGDFNCFESEFDTFGGNISISQHFTDIWKIIVNGYLTDTIPFEKKA